MLSGCAVLGKRVLNTDRTVEPHSLQTESKPKPACLPWGSRDASPAGCEGCLIPVPPDSTLVNFQVHFREFFVFLSSTRQGQQTLTVCCTPRLCEQGCLLRFMLPAGTGKGCEMKRRGCARGFMALAVHLTARLKCYSGFCYCPGSHSHESASLPLKSR